jgi:hypothetical protein
MNLNIHPRNEPKKIRYPTYEPKYTTNIYYVHQIRYLQIITDNK